MPVMRVESIVYGVDDVAAATTYFEEWPGLKVPGQERGRCGIRAADRAERAGSRHWRQRAAQGDRGRRPDGA